MKSSRARSSTCKVQLACCTGNSRANLGKAAKTVTSCAEAPAKPLWRAATPFLAPSASARPELHLRKKAAAVKKPPFRNRTVMQKPHIRISHLRRSRVGNADYRTPFPTNIKLEPKRLRTENRLEQRAVARAACRAKQQAQALRQTRSSINPGLARASTS